MVHGEAKRGDCVAFDNQERAHFSASGGDEEDESCEGPLLPSPPPSPPRSSDDESRARSAATAEPFALGLSLLEAQDVLDAVLQKVHAAGLCQLKAVSVAWCTHARCVLCTRLCIYEGASITDLDVECLNDAGRPWEVAAAGRELPQLARLRGFGFVVDVQAVRQADLGEDGDAPLGGAALRSCIKGEGEPPHELLLAAVACAASGTVYKVPVQRLREDDTIWSLDLDQASLGVISAELLGLMLPAATSVRSLRCPLHNARRQR